MFAPRTRTNASIKREKPYDRKSKPMERSGSLLGTIKNIVSAPLSWFASNQEGFEDLGKRRRDAVRDVSDVEDGQGERTGKRMRVDEPERAPNHIQPPTGGYLDPPSFATLAAQPSIHRNNEEKYVPNRRPSIFGPSNKRTMSVDPPSRYATFNRDPAMVPLPPGSPGRSSPARSVGPEDGAQRPGTPFRLRTSLTPQPSPRKSLRRESSAPPPISNLQSHPMFVKPPLEQKHSHSLGPQKTVSLGTLADFSRASRAPSHDRTLSSLGHTSSISDQIASSVSSDAILQPSKSLSEKTFHELELYKTPIVPSRYKDASAIPPFLRPKRAHVPIPMAKKGRQPKPSLGMPDMASKGTKSLNARDEGKPYARKGGIGKLLAQRKAEEEEEREQRKAEAALASVEEEDEMETDIEPPTHKRDIGVSTLPSGSEDERTRSRNVSAETVERPAAPESTFNDPFSRQPASVPGGRQQPYGRIGRTRIRDPGQRSVPLGRVSNKFSAAFEDDESFDSADQSMNMDDAAFTGASRSEVDTTKVPTYEAPKGFSFAGDTSAISHDQGRAKEPPIPSLPFSIGEKSPAPATAAGNAKETVPFQAPTSAFPCVPPKVEQGKRTRDEAMPTAPKVSVLPPTPDQSVSEAKEKSTLPSFFPAPPSTSVASSTAAPNAALKSGGIPNFFANSSLLSANKSATSAPKTPAPPSLPSGPSASPATPVKDPDNPLWNGNVAAPVAPPKLFAGATNPFTFGAGGGAGGAKPADAPATQPLIPAPIFGGPRKEIGAASADGKSSNVSLSVPSVPTAQATTSTAGTSSTAESPQAQSMPAKTEKKPGGSGPSPFFSFGAGSSNVPKPLFGTGTTTTSPFTAQPVQSSQIPTAETTQKPSFSFGQPQMSDGGNKPPVAQSSQPSQNASGSSEQKSPFMFSASPIPSTAGNVSTSANNDAVAAPKPLFGALSGGTGFTFGSQAATTAPSADATKTTSPFAFGAPPSTPPAGERGTSPFTFGAQAPSSAGSTGFTFGTPVKPNGSTAGSAPSTPTNTSPFTFGNAPARPVTPPTKPDEGMNMEESPVQMDTYGAGQKRPAASMTFGFGETPVNPFGQNTNTGPAFTFGAPSTSTSTAPNPFAPKDGGKPATPDAGGGGGGGFNFNRTASAPTISTSFSFGAKSDQPAPPATAFGASTNPFGQSQTSGTTSSPFAFGQPQQQPAPVSNPFGAPTQPTQQPGATGSAPSSPFSSSSTFTFGAPAAASSNQFTFGSSTPSSPANGVTGLPQTSGSTGSATPFTFGPPSGSTHFSIGAAPPPTAQGSGTPGRAIKKLPRRGPPPKR